MKCAFHATKMAAPPETAKHFMLKDVKTSEKDITPMPQCRGNDYL